MRQPRIRMFFVVFLFFRSTQKQLQFTNENSTSIECTLAVRLWQFHSIFESFVSMLVCEMFICLHFHIYIFIFHCVLFGAVFFISSFMCFVFWHILCEMYLQSHFDIGYKRQNKYDCNFTFYFHFQNWQSKKNMDCVHMRYIRNWMCLSVCCVMVSVFTVHFVIWIFESHWQLWDAKKSSEVMRCFVCSVHFPIVNLWILLFEFKKYAHKHINNELFFRFVPSIYHHLSTRS